MSNFMYNAVDPKDFEINLLPEGEYEFFVSKVTDKDKNGNPLRSTYTNALQLCITLCVQYKSNTVTTTVPLYYWMDADSPKKIYYFLSGIGMANSYGHPEGLDMQSIVGRRGRVLVAIKDVKGVKKNRIVAFPGGEQPLSKPPTPPQLTEQQHPPRGQYQNNRQQYAQPQNFSDDDIPF